MKRSGNSHAVDRVGRRFSYSVEPTDGYRMAVL
jgi:hypothetical protein